MEIEHSCEVYPADANTIISADNFISSSSSEQYFRIEVECKSYLVWDGVGVDRFTNATECGFSKIRKQDIERSVYMLLSYFNVPENDRPRSAAKILACAQHMANVTHKNHRIMGMRVVITNTTQIYQYEYRLRRILEESMNNEDEVLRAKPACKLAIEGLERVKVDQIEGSSVGKYCNCTICFEDFSIDSEVIRLPCSHLFHDKCIFNWLQNRNTCPLCRFKMPTADDQ